MTLHHSIAYVLDTRAAEVAKDIEHTIQVIKSTRSELSILDVTLERLRDEEQAIADARELLQNING